MKTRYSSIRLAAVLISSLASGIAQANSAGPLDPPSGPVAPSGKTLLEVEPRRAITLENCPGDFDSVFKITQPGSYYLLSDVVVTAGKSGIEIATSSVTIDLNGFSVRGVPGSNSGIRTSIAGLTLIHVQQGQISGCGGYGLDLTTHAASGARVAKLTVFNCDQGGIRSGSSGIVDQCILLQNGGTGLSAGENSVVRDNVATQNAGVGIVLGTGSVASKLAARANSSHGVQAGDRCTVRETTASANLGCGISAASHCQIRDCVATGNSIDGIRANSGNQVVGNACSENGAGDGDGAGIYILGPNNHVESNGCFSNDRGIHVGFQSNWIAKNYCGYNTLNWQFVINNNYGPIINRALIASPAVSGNAAAGTLGSSDPNANITW